MQVTLAQIAPRLNRSNLQYIVEIIRSYKEKSDLILFPELALNGYLLQDKLYEDAWTIQELEILEELSFFIDIAVGAALKDGSVFRNAALYYSQGKLISTHYKVRLPNYGMFEEARYFQAGERFESFQSRIGKISMVVCEDLWHEDVHRDLVQEDPDYIFAHVASPARGFNDNGLEIQEKWYEIIKTIALECRAILFFVNRVGFEDGLGFWGGSCTVDASGHIFHSLPRFEQEIKTFDIQERR